MLETQDFQFPLFQYVRLPNIIISDEERKEAGADAGCSNYEFLKCLARTGFKFRKLSSKEYKERAVFELDTVERLGFVDYFLLVWRIMKKAREKKIATDYGRGSCGGSLILYLIGVTKTDPIKYGLYFERFISEIRAKKKVVDGVTYIDGGLAPDIDMDFEQARRHEVIADLYESYPGKVCKISTVSTLSGKILIKEVGKIVLGMNDDDTKMVADLIPKEFGNVWDIEHAAEGKKNKETGEWDKEPVPAFAAWCKKNKEAYEIALSLRDIIKNKGSHPSGFVVSHDDLDTFLPVELLKPTEGEGTEEMSSSFEMGDVAYLTIKVDLLGVRCCSVIADVLNEVGIDAEDINVDSDPLIYDTLQDLRAPHGIFQLEAPTNLKVARAVKPKNLSELSDVLAIARPGALDFLGDYKDRTAKPIHPVIDAVLADTRGVCLFQESALKLFVGIGFNLGEAEIIRRCVTGDTMFLSQRRGWVDINTLRKTGYKDELFYVLKLDGTPVWKPIRDIWSTGIHQTTTVESGCGMTIRATQYHQFYTDSGWKARRMIQSGDYLTAPRSVEWNGENLISIDMARVITGLICEGYFVEGACTFTAWDKEIMDYFRESFKREFGVYPNMNKCGKVARVLGKEKKEIHKYLKYGKSANKEFPQEVMSLGAEEMKTIIADFFSYEGFFSKTVASVSSASRKLLSQLQLMLLRYRINSNLYSKFNKKYNRDYYCLEVGNSEEIEKFKLEFSDKLCSEKRKQLANIPVRVKCNQYDVIPPVVTRRLINQYPFAYHNSGYNSGSFYSKTIGRDKFAKIAAETKDKEWISLASGNLKYTKFDNQNYSTREVETFDFTVDEDTPYIVANGFIIHNCISKKKKEEVDAWKAKIYAKCEENGFEKNVADLIWKICDDSASYSFNRCIFEEETVELEGGTKIKLNEVKRGDRILAFDLKANKNHYVAVKNIFHNKKDCYESDFEGYKIITSSDHKFLCADRMMWALKSFWKGMKTFKVFVNSKKDYLKQHLSSKQVGIKNTIDLEVDHPDHNFYCNDIVVSNSHSTSYGQLSALTCYLKFKYPLQFFCSLLKQAKNEPDVIGEIAKIHEELHMFGIKLLPPCLMKSKDDFCIEGQNIRFGLSSIKGISDKTVANLHNFKNPDANRFQIFESAANAGVSTGVLSALIQAGCMDDSLNGATRSSLVLQCQLWGILTEKERRLMMTHGEKFRFNLFEVYKHVRTLNDEKGKPYIKDTRHKTIMKSYKPKKAIYDENSKHEQLVNFFYEQRRLGYCYSTKLSNVFKNYFPDVVDIRTVQNEYDDARVVFVGMISDKPKETVSKKKNKYAKFQLSDETGTIGVMLFGSANNDRLSQVKFKHGGELPTKEAIVLVTGQKKGDTVFVDDMVDQQVKIYSKFGEIEKKEEEAAPESTL